MSAQYTPDADSVRACYLDTHTRVSGEYIRDAAGISFDRWLNEVKAQAWDEGADAIEAVMDTGGIVRNPYRKGS